MSLQKKKEKRKKTEAETCSNAEATRGHHACVRAVVCGMKLADLGITTEPRGLTASQPRPADTLPTAAVQRTQCGPDVCVVSSIAAAAREDAAQAAFDRKLSHCRNEIGELRQQGMQGRPLVWTADWRPHPAVCRTLQHAVDIASSRNGKQMSAKSLHRRWKNQIQIALCAGGQLWHAQFSRIVQREQSVAGIIH